MKNIFKKIGIKNIVASFLFVFLIIGAHAINTYAALSTGPIFVDFGGNIGYGHCTIAQSSGSGSSGSSGSGTSGSSGASGGASGSGSGGSSSSSGGEPVEICCNGIKAQINVCPGSPGGGSYMVNWTSYFYSVKMAYLVEVPGSQVLGKASRGGVCITIDSECESEEKVDYEFIVPFYDQIGSSLDPV